MVWVRVLLASLVFLAACSGASSDLEVAAGEVGDTVVDGQFTFFVDGLDCGRQASVTNGVQTAAASGEFCLLSLLVSNSGSEARTYDTNFQVLITYAGDQLSSDHTATSIVNTGVTSQKLNPGTSLNSIVVFDVPDPHDLEFARLRDEPLSDGVLVRIDSNR